MRRSAALLLEHDGSGLAHDGVRDAAGFGARAADVLKA